MSILTKPDDSSQNNAFYFHNILLNRITISVLDQGIEIVFK